MRNVLCCHAYAAIAGSSAVVVVDFIVDCACANETRCARSVGFGLLDVAREVPGHFRSTTFRAWSTPAECGTGPRPLLPNSAQTSRSSNGDGRRLARTIGPCRKRLTTG